MKCGLYVGRWHKIIHSEHISLFPEDTREDYLSHHFRPLWLKALSKRHYTYFAEWFSCLSSISIWDEKHFEPAIVAISIKKYKGLLRYSIEFKMKDWNYWNFVQVILFISTAEVIDKLISVHIWSIPFLNRVNIHWISQFPLSGTSGWLPIILLLTAVRVANVVAIHNNLLTQWRPT